MSARILPLGLLGLLTMGGIAYAGGWSDFDDAFPGLPCNDGWAACLVGADSVSPDMVRDDAGRPHPANMRVGFFDFEPLPGFSPFTRLSPYDGGAAVASVEPEPEPEPARAEKRPPPQEDTGTVDGGAEPPDAYEASGGDASVAAATVPAGTAGDQAGTELDASTPLASAGGDSETLGAAGAATEDAVADKGGMKVREPMVRPPDAVTEAPTEAPTTTASAPEPTPEPTPPVAAPPAADPGSDAVAMTTPPPAAAKPPPAAAAQGCDDLVALEAPAMMGQLGVGRRKCLEGKLAGGGSQTGKNKISRVLIADSEARGDRADWERLMKRHLEDIDRSDPDLAFKYAIHLSRGGVGRAHGVIRWSDYALENKQKWSGASYKRNVFGLLKLRAQAANRLWQNAEKKFVADRSDEKEAKAARYRGTAKDYAREWLDYARASGQDAKAPMALCVSAAGSKDFCEG